MRSVPDKRLIRHMEGDHALSSYEGVLPIAAKTYARYCKPHPGINPDQATSFNVVWTIVRRAVRS
jgi:hypothetical protein